MIVFTAPSQVTNIQPISTVVETERSPLNLAVTLQYDWKWRSFLYSLQAPQGECTQQHVRAVTALWDDLVSRLDTLVSLPLTQITPSGAIQLAWDAGAHYLEIDVLPDGKLRWFYRNRMTNELDGMQDEGETQVSSKLAGRLELVLQQ